MAGHYSDSDLGVSVEMLGFVESWQNNHDKMQSVGQDGAGRMHSDRGTGLSGYRWWTSFGTGPSLSSLKKSLVETIVAGVVLIRKEAVQLVCRLPDGFEELPGEPSAFAHWGGAHPGNGMKKGSRQFAVTPCAARVPKRGLEPPLPLREPGPEPGASASSATSATHHLIIEPSTRASSWPRGRLILGGAPTPDGTDDSPRRWSWRISVDRRGRGQQQRLIGRSGIKTICAFSNAPSWRSARR